MTSALLHTAARRSGFGISITASEKKLERRDGRTLLHDLALEGNEGVIMELLRAGENVDPRTLWDFTPLHEAASEGHICVVRVLLKAGADPTAIARDGKTPLLKAAECGHEEVVRTLLEVAGRPLVAAAAKGHLEVVKILLRAGAKPNLDFRGSTPLVASCALNACALDNDAIAVALLDGGADPNYVGPPPVRETALHTACRSMRRKCALTLLEHGADELARDALGRLPSDVLSVRQDVISNIRNSGLQQKQQDEEMLLRRILGEAPQIRRDARWRRRGPVILLRALVAKGRGWPSTHEKTSHCRRATGIAPVKDGARSTKDGGERGEQGGVGGGFIERYPQRSKEEGATKELAHRSRSSNHVGRKWKLTTPSGGGGFYGVGGVEVGQVGSIGRFHCNEAVPSGVSQPFVSDWNVGGTVRDGVSNSNDAALVVLEASQTKFLLQQDVTLSRGDGAEMFHQQMLELYLTCLATLEEEDIFRRIVLYL